ncbi:hypothetical protein SLEP1_g36630 [Rubroshorea leprosula]|uniref:EDR1/CTR1/ARMC3-like peptidase-like domain-containing protein n=1 Tax=Rubroshorea leprosula TaxID=152421 RepID=A0AAV5KSK7_9ROSI|nr:hypothetical protein SLEP1_g36630 [Rubroshorea leprosula]
MVFCGREARLGGEEARLGSEEARLGGSVVLLQTDLGLAFSTRRADLCGCPSPSVQNSFVRLCVLVSSSAAGEQQKQGWDVDGWVVGGWVLLRRTTLLRLSLCVAVLADNIKLTCRLVKGSHYTGVEDDAVNIVKLEDERGFLVDLMAAPGTLIPADIFSAKDTALKSYNPSLSKILTIQSSHDVEVVYLRAKLNVEGGPSGDSAVGTSIISNKMSPNQLDHLPSTAIGASLYKGSRGTNLTVDNLNPFQIKGTGKTYLQNKSTESKVDELQRQKMNVVTSCSPVPLWKNRPAYNEIPKKKEYNYVDGLFPKINRKPYEFHQSASASTSSTKSEKVHAHGFKLSGDSNLPNNDNKSRDRLSDMGQSLMVQDVSTNFNEEKSNGWQDVQNNTVDMVKDQESNEVGLHDRRKSTLIDVWGKILN